jgi:hypothetical protein
MADPAFPTIASPSYPYDEEPEDQGISSGMENGSEISRARFTRSRLVFYLRWRSLSKTDYESLMDFYMNTVKGSSLVFTWTCNNPNSKFYNQAFSVRFASKPKFNNSTFARWGVEVVLREA